MSSTASVSSIYGNGCKWLHLSMKMAAYKCPVIQIHTSRTKASFLPWERSSSEISSELSEWERKSLDRCLGSGIGEPTTSSVSSCKRKGTRGLSRHNVRGNSRAPQQQPTSASSICTYSTASRKTVNKTPHAHIHSMNQFTAPLQTHGWC